MLKAFWHRLARAGDGGVAVTVAAAAPIIIGMAGLGVEAGVWYLDKRQAQTAADAGAFAGALERWRGNSAGVQTAVTQAVTKNGYVNGSDAVVTIHHPPSQGAYAGSGSAVEVIVQRSHQPLFAALFVGGNVNVAARAVAQVQTIGRACVLALDLTASSAIGNKGNPFVDMTGCVLAANSNSQSAIALSGSSQLAANSLWMVGNYTKSGSAQMNLASAPMVNAWALDNPYADKTVGPTGTCAHNNYYVGSGNVTMSPGTYCGGISIGSQATVALNPGTYVIDRGDFNVSAQAVVTCNCSTPGSGVTIVLTSSGATSQIGTVTINGGAHVELKAPSDPSYAHPGLVVYQDERAPSNKTAKFNGGATMRLTGAVYMSGQEVEWAGDNSTTAPTCTEVVARRITFTGNSKIDNSSCEEMGVTPIQITGVRLVE
ncbi:MAG: hypothetical protein KIT81_01825 [Alphaproteobacteria bacterium]|nr:hypothetical protein [Alphaproteobacteria bacterium]